MIKTLTAAAIIAVTASASFAGSFADAVVEAEPNFDAVIAPTGSGIGLPLIIGGVAAAAVVAAVVSNNNDNDDTTGETETAD
jgi:hypothetical protein